MPDDKVDSLSDFMRIISGLREAWAIPDHKELWFRGEKRNHDTPLRPKVYRPGKGRPLRPIPELLKIENELYEDFQRCATQLCNENIPGGDWDWDSYFLMQHHGAPTRLLDWSDGALMALHFALRDEANDHPQDALVYVLEPYRLKDRIEALPEIDPVKSRWKAYVQKHPSHDLSEDEWECSYLPGDEEDIAELPMPRVPLVMEFPQITRRVAAQRSRFIVFGTAPEWLAEELGRPDSSLRMVTVDADSISKIRMELRDSGVTESVIFPDLDGLGREIKQRWEDRM
jgi:hypothetical protein